MIVFDVLDELETYAPAVERMPDVVSVMDHSIPYDVGPGEYEASSETKTKYIVSAHLSSERGFVGETYRNSHVLEICLEGEEMVNVDGSVFKLMPGRFLVYPGDAAVRRGVMLSTPVAFKTVRFLV